MASKAVRQRDPVAAGKRSKQSLSNGQKKTKRSKPVGAGRGALAKSVDVDDARDVEMAAGVEGDDFDQMELSRQGDGFADDEEGTEAPGSGGDGLGEEADTRFTGLTEDAEAPMQLAGLGEEDEDEGEGEAGSRHAGTRKEKVSGVLESNTRTRFSSSAWLGGRMGGGDSNR